PDIEPDPVVPVPEAALLHGLEVACHGGFDEGLEDGVFAQALSFGGGGVDGVVEEGLIQPRPHFQESIARRPA
ncbi:hypothetical protein O988_09667, partial [Pseudogymnoascus sp. VKM F-3808]